MCVDSCKDHVGLRVHCWNCKCLHFARHAVFHGMFCMNCSHGAHWLDFISHSYLKMTHKQKVVNERSLQLHLFLRFWQTPNQREEARGVRGEYQKLHPPVESQNEWTIFAYPIMHLNWRPIYGYFYSSICAVAHWVEVPRIGLQSRCNMGYVHMAER